MNTIEKPEPKVIYWHRDLPPINAGVLGEHTVEAISDRVSNTRDHRDELWNRCFENLMKHARERIEQEIVRLGGDCAHVLDESVDSRHDDVTRETWLHGCFTYILYSLPRKW